MAKSVVGDMDWQMSWCLADQQMSSVAVAVDFLWNSAGSGGSDAVNQQNDNAISIVKVSGVLEKISFFNLCA